MYKLKIRLKSFDLNFLQQTENYLISVFSFFQLNQIKYHQSPKKCKKITVLRSPHIDKKSREQFQLSTHKKTLSVLIPNKKILLAVFEIFKTFHFCGVENELIIEFSTY